MENVLKQIDAKLQSQKHNPSIKPDVQKFLVDFCRKQSPKNILEIGTNLGKSALLMLGASPKANITTLEKDEQVFEKAKNNFSQAGVSQRVTQILGDAKQSLEVLPSQKFDLVFLDGPKAQYVNYLPHLVRLLTSGGTLIADNVFYKGKVFESGVPEKKVRTIVVNLKAFLHQIQNHENLKTQLLNFGDGVSVSTKL